MENNQTKKWIFAFLAGVVSFGVAFWISFNSAKKEAMESAGDSVENSIKKQDIQDLIAQIKKSLPMNMDNGIVWTDMKFDMGTVIYEYTYSDIYVEDIDLTMIDSVIANDKPMIIDTMVSEYDKDLGTKEWLDMIIQRNYNVLYGYYDCQNKLIYSIKILPFEWSEALKAR